jgi:prepilin-type N-terminal cleavage/methylation domain-containing protein
MKTKQGFTLIELVVACTLLMILSTVATTTADNFIQAVKQLQTTNQTLTYKTQVWSLKFTLAQAELAYANAIATGAITDPNAISHWNLLIQENDSADLIPTLAPYFQMPNITDFASLLQRVGMYDPNNSANNPTIQLTTITATATNPVTVATLPTVSWQGITL